MTTLDKLAIRGIRSFDDKKVSVIEFSPVTVIVGHNGSGKTTIIECLKYATTGQYPPNTSRGAPFLHDPRMVDKKEVKAHVKLQFNMANGKKRVAMRSLQVTVEEGGDLSLSTIENFLADPNGNEKSGKVCHISCRLEPTEPARAQRRNISTKCAEINKEVPLLFGVSKAVLENVIFCHQEDSCWPLAEPKALKEKFDAIFESTK